MLRRLSASGWDEDNFSITLDADHYNDYIKASIYIKSTAIKKLGKGNIDLPDDLIQKVQELPGFDDTHKSFYYAHLVEQPHVAFTTLRLCRS
jgi:hypothetical protein